MQNEKEKGINELLKISNLISIILLILSHDFLLIFLNIEFLNFTLYLILGRYNSGIKYILLSSIMTTLLLLVIIIIYSTYGILEISVILSMMNYKLNYIGFLLILLTLFFKLGIFPYHQWTPDLYMGINLKNMIYIQIIIKLGILIFFYNIHSLFSLFSSLFLLLGCLTLLIGALLMETQHNIKRLYSNSSISHMGLIILQFNYSFIRKFCFF